MALDPQSAEVLTARARVSYAQTRYDQAVDFAQAAIQRQPDCEGAYNILGRALFASDRFEEAAALVERALEANGDDYNTYIPYANALGRLGQHEQARETNRRQMLVLERQLELVPEDVRARILLAALYAGFGREDEAKRQAEMAVALRPNDANVLFNAACCYGVLDSKPEALGMLTRAFEAGYGNMDWAARDPDLKCLYDDPEFQRLCSARPADA